MKIGKYKIKAKEFFYDGCHKIYLIETPRDKKDFLSNGWEESDIYTIDQLIEIYRSSCPLKFINTCKLETIVPQFATQVTFTTNTEKITIRN